jgi:thiamine-phosphate pyrophosphorylase
VNAPSVVLTLVTDRRQVMEGRDLVTLAGEAARAGVDLIQLREKDLEGRALLDLAASIVRAVAGTRARVLVSGRPDVALAAGADGVQLPENGLAVPDVKRAFPGLVVGASRHSVDGARRAESEGADFVVLGPVFPTPGKEARALGLAVLGAAARAVAIPVHAIGGIGPANARQVVEAGARGLAAIRAYLEAPADVAADAFRQALS